MARRLAGVRTGQMVAVGAVSAALVVGACDSRSALAWRKSCQVDTEGECGQRETCVAGRSEGRSSERRGYCVQLCTANQKAWPCPAGLGCEAVWLGETPRAGIMMCVKPEELAELHGND